MLVIGNIGRYLNHSCEPNLWMVTVRSNTMVPHLALLTTRAVTEVTSRHIIDTRFDTNVREKSCALIMVTL